MKFCLILPAALSLYLTGINVHAAGLREPFAYAPGEFLAGQTNASGEVWFGVTNTPAPPATGFPKIIAGNLSYPGLPPSAGQSVFIPADTGVMGRLSLNFTVTKGALYFSFLLKVTDVSALNSSGTENNYFAAFGDNVGWQEAALVRAATKVLAKKSRNGFALGVARNSNRPDDWVFDSVERPIHEVLFVVGSYNYSDHTANLWIDPAPTTFGQARPPAPTITARRGADLNRNGIRSFVLGCRTNKPPACVVDELRIGASWSFVTGGQDFPAPTGGVVREASATSPDPEIILDPAGQVLTAGGRAVFQAAATGTAPLTYQWRRDGEKIPGATAPELILNSVSETDCGSFDVEVRNGSGQKASSHPAILKVTSAANAAARPNIIFILCDDLGYGDLGVLFQNDRKPGLPREKTPNLDAFAAEGMQLRQHYCPAPLCAPSRASLLLGVHQGHANVRDQQFDKALEDNHTLGTVLRAAGYATAAIGKWGLGGDDLGGSTPAEWPAYPTRRGFDYFFGYERHGDGHDHYPKEAPYSNHGKQCYDGVVNITQKLDKCYTTDLFTARAKKWIVDQRQARPDQPFFIYLAFDTPHSVYELPTQAYPAGGGIKGGLQWLGEPGHMINTASGKVDSYTYPEFAGATYDDDHNPATPEVPWPEVFQRFASSVRRIDDAVGDVKKLVQDLGIETNTLIIFTSDNGPTIEDALHLQRRYAANFFDNFGPLDGIKRDSFEGGIRMPMFVRWPGQIPAGTTNYVPSQSHDWMPTFSELAGMPAPARADGVSLVPTLTGRNGQRPSTVYVEYFDPSSMPNYAEFESSHRNRERNQMQVIGLNGYQGVRYDVNSPNDNFEIYDVVHDTKEATNLAGNPDLAGLQQQMKESVLQMRRPNASAPRPYDHELIPPSRNPPAEAVVNYSVYEGVWPWVPDVHSLSSVASGRVGGLDLSVAKAEKNFAVEFNGFLKIPTDGNYTFYLDDDAGAVFRLHEATVIDDDFTHTKGEASGSILLKAGLHSFRLTYLHRTGPRMLSLKYAAANLPKQSVPLTAVNKNPRNAALIAWKADGGQGAWLIHAGAVRMEVKGNWLAHTSGEDFGQWLPAACSFSPTQFRLADLFEGMIDRVTVYGHQAEPPEMAALLHGTDSSARDWRRHYFSSTPAEWAADEDGDGAPLRRHSYIADSPTLQFAPRLGGDRPEICFNRRTSAYQVQISADLQHWTTLAGAEISARPSPDLPGFEEVTFRANGRETGYARVQLQ